ncbi:MAG TPA: hypothetical protein VM163_12525, partial [bacterium]|nr:hypothetical protein [bacterium]
WAQSRCGCGRSLSLNLRSPFGLATVQAKRRWHDRDERYLQKTCCTAVITPYDELNLTPFSYDLSIGTEVVSVRPSERLQSKPPYDLDPGETAIVLTREFIALPPSYAATVWPRFSLVREGLFQSMVKIDPTWYGRLAVAMTNLSPRTFKLTGDMPFGTLILYGLREPSDMYLWKLGEIEPVSVDISSVAGRERISEALRDFEGVAWIEGTDLKVRALKQSDYRELLGLDSSRLWKRAVTDARGKWLTATKGDARIVGMYGLGMDDLGDITKGKPKGTPVDLSSLDSETVTADRLRRAAEEHGKPFDLISGIPAMVKASVSDTIRSEIEGVVGRSVYPSVVTLVLRMVGSLSLVVGLIALIIKLQTTSDAGVEKLIVWSIVIFGLTILAIMVLVPRLLLPSRDSGTRPPGHILHAVGRFVRGVGLCLSGRIRHRRSPKKGPDDSGPVQ